MKALRLIIVVALVATFSACEDEHFDKDRCRIDRFSDPSVLYVEQEDDIYQLYWETPKVTTNRNNTEVVFTDKCEYEVCVITVEKGGDYWEHPEEIPFKCFPITRTTGTWASISSEEVAKVLPDVQYFMFAVRLPNMHARLSLDFKSDAFDGVFCGSEEIRVDAQSSSNYNVRVYSSDESMGTVSGSGYYEYGEAASLKASAYDGYRFCYWSDGDTIAEREVYLSNDLMAVFRKDDYTLGNAYPGFNTWFLGGAGDTKGYVDNGEFVIEIEGEGQVWDDNFEVVFHELKNQEEKSEFLMEFDVIWKGEEDRASFRICSGADKYFPEITGDDDSEWNAWDATENTELIFGDDFISGMGKRFTVGSEVEHIQWGGTIGERGEKYIGIEINLAGIEDENGVIYPNGPGTFTISNMQVTINGEYVW